MLMTPKTHSTSRPQDTHMHTSSPTIPIREVTNTYAKTVRHDSNLYTSSMHAHYPFMNYVNILLVSSKLHI